MAESVHDFTYKSVSLTQVIPIKHLNIEILIND